MTEKYKERYFKNLDYFKNHHIHIYEKLNNFNQKESYSLILKDYSSNNELIQIENIEHLKTKNLLYFDNPMNYSKSLANNALENDYCFQYNLVKNIDKIIFSSNGLGFHFEEYNKKFNLKSILIIEEDLELFRLSTFIVDYLELSKDKEIFFCVNESYNITENYILRFYYSLFFYNNSIKISTAFKNKNSTNIIDIFKNNIEKSKLNNTIDYSKLISNSKYVINKINYEKNLNILSNDICNKKKCFTSYFNISINLLIYFNKNHHNLNKLINIMYYWLLYLSVIFDKEDIYRDIRINTLNYFIVLSKMNLLEPYFYKDILSITKEPTDLIISFQKEYILFLKKKKNKTNIEKNFIKHQEYKLEALEGKTLKKSSQEYVKLEFDNFAKSFENKLLKELEYKTPFILAKTVKQYTDKDKKYNILDLGCGTGLLGLELKEISNSLIGIDLSSKMLNIAKNKKIYTTLFEIDITTYLKQCENNSFDMIVSTDVFIYIGDLYKIFKLVNKKLQKEGIFSFSIELLNDNKEYKLNNTGRFSHSKKYINKLIKKFNFIILDKFKTTIRKENNNNVDGYIYVLQHLTKEKVIKDV